MLVYSWYEGIDSLPYEWIRSALVLDRGPLQRHGRAIFVRVSTPIPADGVHAAEEILSEFLTLISADLAKIVVPDAVDYSRSESAACGSNAEFFAGASIRPCREETN